MSNHKATDVRLLAPRQVPLNPEHASDAVALLSELLLEAAASGSALAFAGAMGRGADGDHDGTARSPRTEEGREAA